MLAHDPDDQESVREAVGSWQQRIDKAVQDVHDADQAVQTALKGVVIDGDITDGTLTGFNGQAKGDIDDYTKHEPVPTKTDGWFKATGPAAGFSVTTDPKYGKEASVKAYADLFHVTGKGSWTVGDLKLSATGDVYGGARATANYGFNDKGLVAKAELSAGVRDPAEVRADYGDLGGAYARTDGFAGGELSGSVKVTKEEATVGAKAFYGTAGERRRRTVMGRPGDGWRRYRERRMGTKYPDTGVTPLPAVEVRAALLALNGTGVPFQVRQAVVGEKAHLVAEWQIVLPAMGDSVRGDKVERSMKARMYLAAAQREVRVLDEVREVGLVGDPPRPSRLSHRWSRGPYVGRQWEYQKGPDGRRHKAVLFDSRDMRDPLRNTVLGAGWTWRGVHRL